MLSVSHSLRSIVSFGACQLGPRVSSIVNTPQALSPYAPLSPAIAVAVRPAQPITTPPRLTQRWRRRSASVRLFRSRARPQTQRPIRRGEPGSATMQRAIAEISVRSLGRSSAGLRVTFLGGSTAVSTGQAADLNRHSASIEPNGSATSCHASSMSTYGRR